MLREKSVKTCFMQANRKSSQQRRKNIGIERHVAAMFQSQHCHCTLTPIFALYDLATYLR